MKDHLRFLFVLLGIAVWSVHAADINGKWFAQMTGRGGQTQEYTLTFKVDGDKLTGSVASQRGESPISDGKVSGDELSFSQVVEFGGNQMKFLYKGKISGEEIKFTREREGGQGRTQEFVAKRRPVT